ncbi:MAG: hypothetical protein HY941_12975 [Gammaproteobacteria bacterium]|nr:hypothetical protein [Gammaproteobacteria bacterium]
MKFTKSVLAISIAVAVSGVAGAANKQKDDDSVHQWGRWAVLMPAAGDEAAPLAGADLGGRDLRPEDAQDYDRRVKVSEAPPVEPPAPPVEPPAPPIEPPPVVEGHCVAGAACGYATYEYSYNSSSYGGYGEGDGSYTEGHGARVPSNIDLDVQSTPVETVQVAAIDISPEGDGEVGITADFTVEPNTPDDHYPPVADRHTDGYVSDHGDGTLNWYTSNYDYSNTSPDGGEGYSSTWSNINGGMVPGLTEDTTAGWWADGAEGYGYSYADYYNSYNEWFQSQGSYVAGTATNMAFLDNLNAGNVEANYVGFAMDNGVPVDIHVDFGEGTWNGTWNGGRDGYVSIDTDENGVRHVEGQVGFRASGDLSGPNIVSNQVSADDASRVRGSVEGSFFGSEAQVLGGISDITKTVTADTVGEGGTTYRASRNVDVFVTVEESLADQVGDTFRGSE